MNNPEMNEDFDERPTFNEDIDTEAIENSVRSMLTAFGENPDREGCKTPQARRTHVPRIIQRLSHRRA
jgi:GTP cyclohydrolase I